MNSERETAKDGDMQGVEMGSTEVEEKQQITGDAGVGEPGEAVEQKEITEKERGDELAGIKEGGNAGEKEEVEEGKSGEEDDDGKEAEGTNKRKSVTKGSKAVELSSPKTPGSDRPTRERKTVERFTVNATAKSTTPKPLAIEKGQGTQLKDIPNVAFKLSKRKADENLNLLHTILFGKKAKVHNLKKNIGLFSGFVWLENEGKQKAKLKEKLDKCVKEKLLDFCDVLNIPVIKTSIKKEELSAKLVEFLESPCATTDILLADKEKGKRRKSTDPTSKSPGSLNVTGGRHAKKQKLDSESEKKREHLTEEEDDEKSKSSQSEDDQDDDNKVPEPESGKKGNDSEEETDEDLPKTEIIAKTNSSKRSTKKDTVRASEKSKSVDKKLPAAASNAPGKSTKNSSSSASKKSAGGTKSKSKKVSSTKKQKTKEEMDSSAPAKVKGLGKSSTKVLKKHQEGNGSKKAKKEPSKEEMHAVVVDILKAVDFNTATLSDILRELGKHFGVDLLHRKSEVKDIITDVIKNMSDDEEASDSGDESGKYGKDDDA